jgi:hypothetical protein
MRKLSLILAISFTFISAPVMAQNVTYACQYTDSGGLDWENKRWKLVKFSLERPFFLSTSNSRLTVESVSKAFGDGQIIPFCHGAFENKQTCSDPLGRVLIFDFISMNGAISRIFGGSMADKNSDKDSLMINAFTCTKM